MTDPTRPPEAPAHEHEWVTREPAGGKDPVMTAFDYCRVCGRLRSAETPERDVLAEPQVALLREALSTIGDMVRIERLDVHTIIAQAMDATEAPPETLPVNVTVLYGEPYPAPGTTVLHGLTCSTCGHDLTVPLFHPGQGGTFDHKPTLDLSGLAAHDAEVRAEAVAAFLADPETRERVYIGATRAIEEYVAGYPPETAEDAMRVADAIADAILGALAPLAALQEGSAP